MMTMNDNLQLTYARSGFYVRFAMLILLMGIADEMDVDLLYFVIVAVILSMALLLEVWKR